MKLRVSLFKTVNNFLSYAPLFTTYSHPKSQHFFSIHHDILSYSHNSQSIIMIINVIEK